MHGQGPEPFSLGRAAVKSVNSSDSSAFRQTVYSNEIVLNIVPGLRPFQFQFDRHSLTRSQFVPILVFRNDRLVNSCVGVFS